MFPTSLQLVDGVSRHPLVGVRAQVCNKVDVDCLSPVGNALVSDDNGTLNFDAPGGFDGYVSLQSADIAPTLYFFNPPVSGPTGPFVVSLLTPAMMTLLASEIGSTLAPDRGVVNLTALDCQGHPAAGVSFSSSSADAETLAFYSVEQLPTAKASATDTSGFGGLANVAAGVATVDGILADGRKVATLSVLVRPSSITYSQLVPRGN